MLLQTTRIKLRALEPEDLDILYQWENDTTLWSVSCASEPYSRYILKEYIAHSDKTIYEKKQLRLMIERKEDGATIGIIDLFDFDAFHMRAGIGVLIGGEYQGNGYATEALQLLKEYSFDFLNIYQLYAHIPSNNKGSIRLFKKCGFKHTGRLINWIREGDLFIDVELKQLQSKRINVNLTKQL